MCDKMGRRGGFKGGTGKAGAMTRQAARKAVFPVQVVNSPHTAGKSPYEANTGLAWPVMTVPARRRSWDVFRRAPGGPDFTFYILIYSDLFG